MRIFHGVRICDSAIEAAVALSDRYVSGRELPDKAVDLIDEAASRLRIGIESPPSDLGQVTQSARRVEMELIALDRSGGTASLRSELEHELAALRMQAAAMSRTMAGGAGSDLLDPADQGGADGEEGRGSAVGASRRSCAHR